ncbi:hypothetical protein JCM5350_006849 [Sporobolomyces pararoseus]
MRSTTSNPFHSLLFLALLCCLISPSLAFFEHLFNQQQAHHQQQQQQTASIKWEDQFSNKSLVCVDKPRDCPCPYSDYDKKCLIPGGSGGEEDSFVCARDCEMVKKALRG